jgi:hypothetical protein
MHMFWQRIALCALTEYYRPNVEHKTKWRIIAETTTWAILASLTKEGLILNKEIGRIEPTEVKGGLLQRVALGAILQYFSPNVAQKKTWRIMLETFVWITIDIITRIALTTSQEKIISKQTEIVAEELSYDNLKDAVSFRLVVLHPGNLNVS